MNKGDKVIIMMGPGKVWFRFRPQALEVNLHRAHLCRHNVSSQPITEYTFESCKKREISFLWDMSVTRQQYFQTGLSESSHPENLTLSIRHTSQSAEPTSAKSNVSLLHLFHHFPPCLVSLKRPYGSLKARVELGEMCDQGLRVPHRSPESRAIGPWQVMSTEATEASTTWIQNLSLTTTAYLY